MSIYLGTSPIAVNSSSRNIGEIIQSTIPLSDAGLHLLDGALISGAGSYSAFVTYIAGLVSSYPDLFETEANWQTAVSTYGVCGKFVYNSVNNTVRLPKITGFTEGTIDPTVLGDLVQAGLPNITGNAYAGGYAHSTVSSGALYTTLGSYKRSTGSDSNNATIINIDASRSSLIYGNSTTVQPQSIKVLYYIVIASSITNELNLDVADMATKSLDNLDNTGKNIANWSNNVTNCITEIPQDIKLELNNGTLTLKAGSKVYVPNGSGVFDTVTIASDIAMYGGSANGSELVYLVANGSSLYHYLDNSSGTDWTATSQYQCRYNTTDNMIKNTNNTGSTWLSQLSFPIARVKLSSGTVTSIEQVFNGFGYIGSTVFALPGVKGLIPNGRNADGSLNNIEFTTSSVLTATMSGNWTDQLSINLKESTLYTTSTTKYYEDDNKVIDSNGYASDTAFIGSLYYNNGNISNFISKTAFHAVDYNDSPTISGWGMPSSRYIDLTLGASGSTYTAPANGWVVCRRTPTAVGQELQITNNNGGSASQFFIQSGRASGVVGACLPVKKGDVFAVAYTLGSSTNQIFRFIYAEGEKNV